MRMQSVVLFASLNRIIRDKELFGFTRTDNLFFFHQLQPSIKDPNHLLQQSSKDANRGV